MLICSTVEKRAKRMPDTTVETTDEENKLSETCSVLEIKVRKDNSYRFCFNWIKLGVTC